MKNQIICVSLFNVLNLGTSVIWKWFEKTHSFRYYMKIDIVLCYICICLFNELKLVTSVIEKFFKQTQCASYSMMIDMVMFHYLTSEKNPTQIVI